MASVIETLIDGPRNVVIHVEGTGAVTAEIIVNVSALATDNANKPCTDVTLRKLTYDTDMTSAAILWDATTDTRAFGMSGQGFTNWNNMGGLQNNSGAGKTGDVLLTTVATAGTHYSFTLECVKKYA